MVKWHRREEVVGKEIIDGEAKKIGTVRTWHGQMTESWPS